MEHYDVKRLALVLAVQAEIEGMNAENMQRQQSELSMAFDCDAFNSKAEDLRILAYCHDEQL